MIPDYPKFSGQLSALVQFFSNESWRMHTYKMLHGKGVPGASVLLKAFTASLAKWRYETAANVLEQLSRYEQLRKHIKGFMFTDTQEKELLQVVIAAFADDLLWALILAVSVNVITPLEGMRHWGLVCPCEQHIQARREGKKVFCDWASRRLHQAPQFIRERRKDWEAWIDQFDIDDAGGFHVVFSIVRALMLQASALMQTWFAYLDKMPWRIADADNQVGAQACVDQINAKPTERHDPLTQAISRELMNDLQACAAGQGVSEALRREVKLMRMAPLDEGPGEGYHRGTTQEKNRAAPSTTITLKCKNRHRQSLRLARWFMTKCRRHGREVVRSDWRTATRLLQTAFPKRYVPMTNQAERVLPAFV